MSIPGSASPLFFQAAAGAGGYEIERSLRFNSADSAYLNRTPSSAGNRKTWTWAGWVKKTRNAVVEPIFYALSGANYGHLYFASNDTIQFDNNGYYLTSTAVYRDNSSWYHMLLQLDSTQAVAADRAKLYVNGVQVSITFPLNDIPLNYDGFINTTVSHRIGATTGSYSSHYLADIHFIDGQALAPTDFGEFDDNGVWQPIAYTGTYGTNGFHLFDFANVSGIGEDSSGNDNDWTVNNLTYKEVKTFDGIAVDGNDDYLSLSDDPDFDFGSGDFCMECWIKPSAHNTYNQIMNSYGASGNRTTSWNLYLGKNSCYFYHSGGNFYLEATATCPLDTWSHVAITREGNTFRLFTNGNLEDSTVQNVTLINSTADFTIGGPTNDFNGFYSNVRVVKGSAVYTTSFTPETSLTNITNTVLLCCQSNSSATAATVSPGTITANGNVFAGTFNDSSADIDVLYDSPTNGTQTDTGAGGEVSGNYATLNPLVRLGDPNATFSNGNLTASFTSANNYAVATIGITSGKYYYELTASTGVSSSDAATYIRAFTVNGVSETFYHWRANGGTSGLTGSPTFSTYASGDVLGVGIDATNSTVRFYKNGTLQGSGDYSYTTFPGKALFISAFANPGNRTCHWNFGQRPFAYAAPSGFKALCTTNLPDPTIADGSTAFDAVTYTGNSSTNVITGLNFSPDFLWIKARTVAGYDSRIIDSVRGADKLLYSSLTSAEATGTTNLTSFDSNGFTLGANSQTNLDTYPFIAWTWDAGTSTVSNTDGSITSSVRANPSAGFSIVSYTGNGTAGATVGHGLNAEPSMVITKTRETAAANNWTIYHKSIGNTKAAYFDTNSFYPDAGYWNNTSPTSSVVTLGNYAVVNASSKALIMYAFAPVEGYSAFGSYAANGLADGPFVYTGFAVAWVMTKRSDGTGRWEIHDYKRPGYNSQDDYLRADSSAAESSADCDFLSNGFKIRNTLSGQNASGGNFIYAAFAENPFKTARAR